MLVYPAHSMPQVPLQQVYVGGVLDRYLVCQSVETTREGSTARFDAVGLYFDSDKRVYLYQPVLVYVDGTLIFRGWFDISASNLRDERVTLTARSPYYWIRRRELVIHDEFGYQASPLWMRTLARHHETTFPANNPYTLTHEAQTWQPWDMLGYFKAMLDSFWDAQFAWVFDPEMKPIEPFTQTLYEFTYSTVNKRVELTTKSVSISPNPDQTFRMATWGELFDYFGDLLPGLFIEEMFNPTFSTIVFTRPGRAGAYLAPIGVPGYNFTTIGANVTDLSLETGQGDLCNRVVAFGDKVVSLITVASETVDSAGNLGGLIPDWDLYDTSFGSVASVQFVGAAEYDYTTNAYALSRTSYQRVYRAYADPRVTMEGEPQFVPGYEGVGRKWRLPNWFHHLEPCDSGLLTDPQTQMAVDWQVFVMRPVQRTVTPTVGDPFTAYYYEWQWVKEASFDKKTLEVTLRDFYWHHPIADDGLSLVTAKWKLARVAFTCAWKNPDYALYADTYLAASKTVDPNLTTVTTSGQAFCFERPDLGQTILTNFQTPIARTHAEYVPAVGVATVGSRVTPIAAAGMPAVAYPYLIVYAGNGAGDAGVMALQTAGAKDAHLSPAIQAQPTASYVTRDDAPALWFAAQQTYAVKSHRPRKFQVDLVYTQPGLRRGHAMYFKNLRNYRGDADYIDAYSHDLIKGTSSIVTTNQPSDKTVNSTTRVRL